MARYVLVVLLAPAMSMQNATARKLAVPDLTTTVLTPTIAGIFADGRLACGAAAKIGRRLLWVLAMSWARWSAPCSSCAPISALVLIVVAVAAAIQSRSDRRWVHAPGSQPAERDDGARR